MGDGFGEMLRACWGHGPRPALFSQVIERNDGFVSVEDAYRYFSKPDEWVAAEQLAIEKAHGRVLDVGCAAGRHMLALAERFEVVGIDPSPGAIEVARAQCLDARLGTALEPGREVGPFDTILLLGGNLGLLGSAERAPVVLAGLGKLAEPDARLLAVGHDPYVTVTPDHLAYHERNRAAGRLPGQVRMRVRYRTWRSGWFDRLLLSCEELAELVAGSGWTLEGCSSPGVGGFFLAELRRTPETDQSKVLGRWA